MRPLPVVLKLILALVVLGAVLWLASESQRQRGTAHAREQLLVEQRQDHQKQVAQLKATISEREAELTTIRKELVQSEATAESLRGQVVRQQLREKQLTELMESAVERANKQWQQVHQKVAKDRRPMPLGLRLGLVALNECLHGDGYHGIRFTGSSGIDNGKVMRDAEVFEHDRDRLSSNMYLPDETTFHLDRSKGTLTMRFKKGKMVLNGKRMDIPETGHEVVLKPVFGPLWERRVPYLVQAEGEYPQETARKKKPNTLDLVSIGDWLVRFDQLLKSAKTPVRYRVDRFRGLEKGTFQEVLLLGYDDKDLYCWGAEAKEMQVLVNERRKSVELLLKDGVLHQKGGKSNIPSSGYRILLFGVTPEAATNGMLGMVVNKK